MALSLGPDHLSLYELMVDHLESETPLSRDVASGAVRLPDEDEVFEMGRALACRAAQAGTRASLVAQTVKNPPAMQETWVQSLGLEDPLEEGMATHCSILTWRIPWTEEPAGLQSMGCKESDTI